MKKFDIANNVSRAFHKVGFKLKKHSPEILVISGVIGMGVTVVTACKATTKLDRILINAKETVEKIHEAAEHPEVLPEEYTVEDSKKDLAITYAKTGIEIVKLYGPSIILGVASSAAILSGTNILHKRNAALAAAYATMDNSFKKYRGRLIDRFGKELDKELKYDIKTKEIEEVVVKEDGTEVIEKKTVNVVEPDMKSGYARCFDETCCGWTRDSEYNLMFLTTQQAQMNKKLQSQGCLYLNDVYEALGFQKSAAGQVVGWIYDEKNPVGDNYVDFGIHDLHDKEKRLFVNGYEKSIWLDFNVDGNILDLMP